MRQVALLLLAVSAVAQPGPEKPPPPQPIPFSHKQHVVLGVKCLDCHSIKKPGFAAGIPREDTCMGCHASVKTDSPAIRKLAEFHKAKQPVPWAKVYRVPDYVWFSHETHFRIANLGCENCHGPVAERDVIVQEKPVSMVSCIECHDKRGAPKQCNVCHDMR